LKTPSVRPLQLAGVLCAVAVLFYCAYTRSYEAVSVLILLVFFAYFMNLKSGLRSPAPRLSPASDEAVLSPIRELAKGLAFLVAGGIGVGIGLALPDVRVGVALALTAAVTGVVAFVVCALRALGAWNSG
jgi:hypothetical protein